LPRLLTIEAGSCTRAFYASTCRTDMSSELYASTAIHLGKEPPFPV